MVFEVAVGTGVNFGVSAVVGVGNAVVEVGDGTPASGVAGIGVDSIVDTAVGCKGVSA